MKSRLTIILLLISQFLICQKNEIDLIYGTGYKVCNSLQDSSDFFHLDTILLSNSVFDSSWNSKRELNPEFMFWESISFNIKSNADSLYQISYNLKLNPINQKDSAENNNNFYALIGNQVSGTFALSENSLMLKFENKWHNYEIMKIGSTFKLVKQKEK